MDREATNTLCFALSEYLSKLVGLFPDKLIHKVFHEPTCLHPKSGLWTEYRWQHHYQLQWRQIDFHFISLFKQTNKNSIQLIYILSYIFKNISQHHQHYQSYVISLCLREAIVINHEVKLGNISQQGGGGQGKIKNFPRTFLMGGGDK